MKTAARLAAILAALAAIPAHSQPADQRAFVAVNEAAQPTNGQESPLQGIERKLEVRDKAACKAKPKPEIHDWVGTVTDMNRQGDSYLFTIAIGHDVFVTQSISMSFLPRETREQRSESDEQVALVPLLNGLRTGDQVVFSGRFYLGYIGKCPAASNFRIVSRHDRPEYIVRLRSIAKL